MSQDFQNKYIHGLINICIEYISIAKSMKFLLIINIIKGYEHCL